LTISLKQFSKARFNWYLQLKEGRLLLLLNYVGYTGAFLVLPNFPNNELGAQMSIFAPFLLGFVPLFIHLYCSYWLWAMANAFNILTYYQKKMDEYKIINIGLNLSLGCGIWFVVYANFSFLNGSLKPGFMVTFFSMVFSWQHLLLMLLIHSCSVVLLGQLDFSERFYDALYNSIGYPKKEEAIPETQKINTTTQIDQFDLYIPSFIYAISDGNYTDIYLEESGNQKILSKRISIKELYHQISKDPRFFRCHNSYIINFDSIDSYSGNSHGLKIKLTQATETIIPVSRNHVRLFKAYFQDYLRQKDLLKMAQLQDA
jgi:hypothetical protein